MMATAEDHQDVVSALLSHPDIDPNIVAWVCALLLSHLCHFNVTIETFILQDGKSALTIAAEDGMAEIVSSLIAHPRTNINVLDMVRLYHIE